MKKRRLLVVTATLLASTTLTSCNFVDAGKIEDIAGTYQMITWEYTHYYEGRDYTSVADEDKQTIDVLKENGVTNYIVINTSGSGYYVYKDNETPSYAIETKQIYEVDDEDNTLVEKITVKDAEQTEWRLYVQCKKHTFTSNKSAWKSSFHIGKTEYTIGNKDKITMKWKRVNKAQDLKYVKRKMNIDNYLPLVEDSTLI